MKYERYPDELSHYGVKGMKWGVRRRRFKAGAVKINNSINKKNADKWRQLSNNSNKFDESGGKIGRSITNIQRRKAAAKIDLSQMSDKELRDRVNRMNTEKQYRQLSTESIGSGKDYVMDAITIGAGALGVTSSALGIAVAIKQLKAR